MQWAQHVWLSKACERSPRGSDEPMQIEQRDSQSLDDALGPSA